MLCLPLTNDMLAAVDSDNDASQLVYTPQSTWSDMKILVDGVERVSFTQQDIDNGLVSFVSVGSTDGLMVLPLNLNDGKGATTDFDINVEVNAIPVPPVVAPPEPAAAIAEVIPEPVEVLEISVLNELPEPIAAKPIIFEPLEKDEANAIPAVEDDKQPVVGQAMEAQQNAAEQAAGEPRRGAGGSIESLAVLEVQAFSNNPLRISAEEIMEAITTPVQTIQKSIELTETVLKEQQLASLLSLDPLTVSELSSFQSQERNAGLQSSIQREIPSWASL